MKIPFQNLFDVGNQLNAGMLSQSASSDHALLITKSALVKPGSHMPPTYLGRGRRHGLGQHCGICEHLSPIHNLSQALIAGLPAKLNSTQLRRQVGG